MPIWASLNIVTTYGFVSRFIRILRVCCIAKEAKGVPLRPAGLGGAPGVQLPRRGPGLHPAAAAARAPAATSSAAAAAKAATAAALALAAAAKPPAAPPAAAGPPAAAREPGRALPATTYCATGPARCSTRVVMNLPCISSVCSVPCSGTCSGRAHAHARGWPGYKHLPRGSGSPLMPQGRTVQGTAMHACDSAGRAPGFP